MIIENGTITVKAKEKVNMDIATGFPTLCTVEWCNAIACQYIPDSIDQSNKTNNEYVRTANYTILIDQQEFPSSGILKLMDRKGCELGMFPIISVEALDAVCQLKIKV